MIHYHGTPMTPIYDAVKFFAHRHAMVSYATIAKGGADQLPVIAEVAQSFVLDNGAFTAWRSGKPVADWSRYYEWAALWLRHPGCEWALIPDVIDGSEEANDALAAEWPHGLCRGVPIWHLHESIGRLIRLCDAWPRVALGSSGAYSTIGTGPWWDRMSDALSAICDEDGSPKTKLHGLRMMDPAVFGYIPFASADSTNVAQNKSGTRWEGPYAPKSSDVRALVIADRVEASNAASRWVRRSKQYTLADSRIFGGC